MSLFGDDPNNPVLQSGIRASHGDSWTSQVPMQAKPQSGRVLPVIALLFSGISLVVSSILFVTTVVFGSALASKVDSVTVAQSGDEAAIDQYISEGGLFHEPQNLGEFIDAIRNSTFTIYCGSSSGSGWAIDLADNPDSSEDDDKPFEIVTNFHVVEECWDTGQQITFTILGDPQEYEADLWSIDASSYDSVDKFGDLALLITAKDVTSLPVADAAPSAGHWVMAVGSPGAELGSNQTLDGNITFGRVTKYFEQEQVIVTDTAINYGNSGGPLINSAGQVVGTNTWTELKDVSDNIAYAIGIPVLCADILACESGDTWLWGSR